MSTFTSRLERRFADVLPAELTGPDPNAAPFTWLDVAVILDASAPSPFVEATFDAIANRPLPLPGHDRIATRIDLVTCAGLVPQRKQYGHSLRLLDADRQLTVADAIRECAEVQPPPQVLVLVSDRAPTGEWQAALAAWTLHVERRGGKPTRLAIVWDQHLAELDGFAREPLAVESVQALRAELAKLWTRSAAPHVAIGLRRGSRCCPPRPDRAVVLKPVPEIAMQVAR